MLTYVSNDTPQSETYNRGENLSHKFVLTVRSNKVIYDSEVFQLIINCRTPDWVYKVGIMQWDNWPNKESPISRFDVKGFSQIYFM